MSPRGGSDDLLVRTRGALRDALDALSEQREADEPLLQLAMARAGFVRDPASPGAWVNESGVPVDLMVPAALSSTGRSRCSAGIPPHERGAARQVRGLEAAVVDWDRLLVDALDPSDTLHHQVKVAGPAALVVAKVWKVVERLEVPDRLQDKDAQDLYRILVDVPTQDLVDRFELLRAHPVCARVVEEARGRLHQHFAVGPGAVGSQMAGRAEEGIGEPDTVSSAVSLLAADLLRALDVP